MKLYFNKKTTFCYVILFFITFHGCNKKNKIFNSNEWKKNLNQRYLMTDDLIKSKLLMNKSKEFVLMILGNDFELGPCDSCIGYSTLNPNQSFSIDHEVLAVFLDSNNVVNSVSVECW